MIKKKPFSPLSGFPNSTTMLSLQVTISISAELISIPTRFGFVSTRKGRVSKSVKRSGYYLSYSDAQQSSMHYQKKHLNEMFPHVPKSVLAAFMEVIKRKLYVCHCSRRIDPLEFLLNPQSCQCPNYLRTDSLDLHT